MVAVKRQPWHPVAFSVEEARAAQAFDAGVATAGQMKTLLDWLWRETRLRDEVFAPGADDVRTYLMGKRSVALAFVAMLKFQEETTR